MQECRIGENGIRFGAGKGKLQVTGSGQITFRALEISLDAVQKIGQYKMAGAVYRISGSGAGMGTAGFAGRVK